MYLEKFFGAAPSPHPCKACGSDDTLDFDVRMAFQPIVDARDRSIFGYEALVRTEDGGVAAEVIARVTPAQLYRFDQTCRVKAIETAARLGLQQRLSINFFPNAVYEPATCIRLTLTAAQMFGFPTDKLIFETAESEQVRDHEHLTRIFRDYRNRGFLTAIDDFGAGYAGLKLLADFQPDLLKLDIALIRGIDTDPVRTAIVRGVVQIADAIGCTLLAEGVETEAEYRRLRALGVPLFQGYLFGRPQLERLDTVPDPLWDQLERPLDA
ncbi:EAL domain-containing protein [Luteimonas fraxinea]|uniref:EAL domain-containing protein n=1 Tax=Luteimonas fraxinea TaxID=2901869 RepID=A0ABS8UAX0_9GAMM|nr:EAL domain-containing protein [Luteimonas fraxinea]MCD9095665.1 EAL domain-containing protein [Luteimonas fraxinea]UHH11143.1 EAL domain-containing protein [Luteimonas fraxinea]